jgi:hypothetical protein
MGQACQASARSSGAGPSSSAGPTSPSTATCATRTAQGRTASGHTGRPSLARTVPSCRTAGSALPARQPSQRAASTCSSTAPASAARMVTCAQRTTRAASVAREGVRCAPRRQHETASAAQQCKSTFAIMQRSLHGRQRQGRGARADYAGLAFRAHAQTSSRQQGHYVLKACIYTRFMTSCLCALPCRRPGGPACREES